MSDTIAQANAAAAAAVIAAFRTCGGDAAVVSPGSRSTPLVQAIAAAGLDARVVLDERTAAFVALGRARVTRRSVLVVCTSGSAGAHYAPAVVEAVESGLPLWVVTADRPPELHGIGAPQTTCQEDWFGRSIARVQVPAADETEPEALIASLVDQAPARGPLHLNIGFREPLLAARVPQGPEARVDVTPPTQAASPCPGKLAAALAVSRRPLLVAGPEAAVGGLAGHWPDWALTHRVPLITDVLAGLCGGLRGMDAVLRSATVRDAVAPDLVIQIGRLPTSKAIGQWLAVLERAGVPVWHISPDDRPHAWTASSHVVPGPVETPSEAPLCDADWVDVWRRLADAVNVLQPSDGVFWEAHLWRELARWLPDDARVVVGSSMPVRDADQWFVGAETACVLSNRGVNGIDGGVATACGIGWAAPGRPVVGVLGDLAFLHDAGALLELRRQTGVRLIVIDNGGGGIFSYLSVAARDDLFQDWFLTPQEVDPADVAAGYGLTVAEAGSARALRGALDGAAQVIVARIDRRASVAAHQSFWRAAAGQAELTLRSVAV